MKKVKVMTAEVKIVFDEIRKDVLELHYRWRAFNELYSDTGAIELMNDAAPNFFSYTYDAMLSDLVSSISRLTDKRSDTLGFPRLIQLVQSSGNKGLAIRINARVRKYLAKVGATKVDKHPIRMYRHKRVSHSDYSIRTDAKAKGLPILRKKYFETALADFRQMLNLTEEYFGGVPTSYQDFHATDSGSNLIYYLRIAKHVLKSPDRDEMLTKFMTARGK